jgi:hypothetical protein
MPHIMAKIGYDISYAVYTRASTQSFKTVHRFVFSMWLKNIGMKARVMAIRQQPPILSYSAFVGSCRAATHICFYGTGVL